MSSVPHRHTYTLQILLPAQSFQSTLHDTTKTNQSIASFGAQVSVTYDDEPGPEGFERVSRDLAKGGTSGRKAFLWLKRHAQQRPNTTLASQTPSSDKLDLDGMQDGAPAAAAGVDTDVMPIGEVVVAFGSADPNVEEAAEIAEQDRAAVATDQGGGQAGGAGERRAVRVWERLDRSLSPPAADVMEGGDGQQQQEQGGGLPAFLWFRRVSEEEPLSWSAHSLTVRALDERGTNGTE